MTLTVACCRVWVAFGGVRWRSVAFGGGRVVVGWWTGGGRWWWSGGGQVYIKW
jgi:hypothetical protein